MTIPQSRFLEKHLKNIFEIFFFFLSFENRLLGYSKTIFQEESPRG